MFMFWGPHSAGHQSPAALHVDLTAAGRRLTDAPRSEGYEDPMHLTWVRTTIAHNTVTVDGAPMFPYDQGGDSIWEADRWRERPSDGKLELFEARGPLKVCRASNERVYPGVRLDRTVLLSRGFAVDVFRALSDEEHHYDWAMHCPGELRSPAVQGPADLGQARGYRHFEQAAELETGGGAVALRWDRPGGATLARIVVPAGARVIVARDPSPPQRKPLGEREEPSPSASRWGSAKSRRRVGVPSCGRAGAAPCSCRYGAGRRAGGRT